MEKKTFASYKGYCAEIRFNLEAKMFQGQVINIKDIVVFECQNLETIQQEFQKSIEVYLLFCQRIKKLPEIDLV